MAVPTSKEWRINQAKEMKKREGVRARSSKEREVPKSARFQRAPGSKERQVPKGAASLKARSPELRQRRKCQTSLGCQAVAFAAVHSAVSHSAPYGTSRRSGLRAVRDSAQSGTRAVWNSAPLAVIDSAPLAFIDFRS